MTKLILSFITLVFIISCTTETHKKAPLQEESTLDNSVKREIVNDFQILIDSIADEGSVLIYKPKNNTYYSNNFDWSEKGHLPASTFKIPNSIIALELGLLENDSSIFYWDGEDRYQERWERDLNFKEALQLSCVPCYQNLAREIGTEPMITNLAKIGYPEMTIDSSTIDMFWLEGESRITSFEQIDFLQRFYNKELQISDNTFASFKNMMVIEENENYKLSGKSGWSYTNGIDNCWFVGYVENETEVYFFATNLQPAVDVDITKFSEQRNSITIDAFSIINLIK